MRPMRSLGTFARCVIVVAFAAQMPSAEAISYISVGPLPRALSGGTSGSGPISLDSGIVNLDRGLYRSRAFADDTTGTLRAYGEVDIKLTGPALSTAPPTYAAGSATIQGSLSLQGPGTAAVPVLISVDFHGSFSGSTAVNVLSGEIDLLVAGGVSTYTSSLGFQQSGDGPVIATPRAYKNEARNPDRTFAAGTPSVLSTQRDSLQGRLFMPVSIAPGDSIEIFTHLIASSGAYLRPFPDYSGSYKGTSDGYNTAQLHFLVPAGYSLVGQDGAFSGVMSAVPEPGTGAMMLAGLAAVLGACNERRRRRVALT